jgi:hypothetical protein
LSRFFHCAGRAAAARKQERAGGMGGLDGTTNNMRAATPANPPFGSFDKA